MRAPIQTNKHYVQKSLATVLAGAALTIQIAKGVEAPSGPDEVRVGSLVKAVYVEMWVRAGDTSPGSSLLSVYKSNQGSTMNFAEQVSLHTYNGKNQIFYHTQGLTNDQDADAIPFIRQWIKIPRGKQRMALSDSLNLNVAAQALDNIICGFMTYKEYF